MFLSSASARSFLAEPQRRGSRDGFLSAVTSATPATTVSRPANVLDRNEPAEALPGDIELGDQAATRDPIASRQLSRESDHLTAAVTTTAPLTTAPLRNTGVLDRNELTEALAGEIESRSH